MERKVLSSATVALFVILTLTATLTTASGTIEVDEEVQINPTDDAHVAEGYPANNYSDTALYLQSYTADYKNERIFLKFDLGIIPTSAEIVQAKLHLYSWKGRYANVVAQCRAVQDDTWGETTLTWNSQPAYGEVLDTVLLQELAAENKWHSWDVTSFVRNQFKGDKVASLALRAEVEGASGQYSFESKEWVDATLHPNLEVIISYTEYPRLPTDLDLTPSTFTVSSENSLTLTVTLTSDDTPLAGKTILFTAILGSVSPNTGTTDSEGKVSVTYTAPKISVRTSATVNASFAGDLEYKASNASSSGTVEARPALPAVVTITTRGAAFSIPETIKDDVSNFAVTIPAEIQNLLPVPVPTTGFLLLNKENLSLVLAQESDKGLASVEGWPITPNITLGGFDLGVIVAKSVSFTQEGTTASIGVIIANPEYYELELVKIDATRRHVSILYDPDDGSGIKFPVTAGYLVENPVSAPELVKAAIRRGKELLLNSGRDIVQGILIKEQTRLPVFDFETDYWIDSPAVTNGIVLLPGSRILRLLENVVPEAGELIQVEANLPVLYDVKTDLKSEPVSSVQEIKQSPDVYRDKVVELTVYGYQGTISIQEYIEAATGGEVKILIDVRLEGMITWNTLSIPPEREELLIAAGASSVEQDTVFETQLAEFRLVGRVVSTKTIDESLPEALALIIFEEEKLRDVTLEELVMERIEENLAELNWTLTNFTEEAIPQIPVTSPSSVVYPVRPVVIQTPEEIPQIRISVRVEVHVEVVTPELPLRLKIDNSKISEVFVDLKQQMEDVRVIAEKLAEKPPELPEPPGLVWAYHEININVPEEAIENAEINFWVLKEWLATQGASKESIRLLRFHEGGWKELPTEILGENATHVSYRARTPGFSVFAIAAPPAGINMMLIGAFIVAIIAVITFVALKKR